MTTIMCGRPTKKGTPCTNRMQSATSDWELFPAACWKHITEEESAEFKQRETDGAAPYARDIPTRPACWSWPVTEQDTAMAIPLWQDGRCAICGARTGDLVRDHDHETGWRRGLICQSCNALEAYAERPVFRRYRKHNPAKILGVWDRYCNTVTGLDFGRLNGHQTRFPIPVDSSGVVYIRDLLEDDPAWRVTEATHGRE